MLTRDQVKAARTVRGWGVRELSTATVAMFGKADAVSVSAITRYENGSDSRGETLRRLQLTLEAEGFEFLNSGRPGVRWDVAAPERWRKVVNQPESGSPPQE